MGKLSFAFLATILVSLGQSLTVDDNTGSIRLLFQNDLSLHSKATSALLLHTPQSHARAISSCHLLHEQLLGKVTSDVQDQLSYLIHSNQLYAHAELYVASAKDGYGLCSAYDVARRSTVKVDCARKLSVLCTQSAKPYTYEQFGKKPSSNLELVVKSDGYTYNGFRDARSFRYLGIPFAAPPVKNLRFAPPQPYTGSKYISALSPRQPCIQAPNEVGTNYLNLTITPSEDCLTLNVYTPYLPSNGKESCTNNKRAVMVYFFGGSYLEGNAALPDYDGGNLVSRGDVVVVTVQYRVGILGFLTTETEVNGSMGIQDQISALKWVKKNIEAFGGDPSRVTLLGQSAGGQSVYAHLSSTASTGLFAAGIIQSGPLGDPWGTRSLNARHITPVLANATNCTNISESAMVSCLRSLPASLFVSPAIAGLMTETAIKVIKAWDGSGPGIASSEPYLPITAQSGGPKGVIDDQFEFLVRNGTMPNRVPLMVGEMRNEGGLFVPSAPGFNVTFPNNVTLYHQLLDSGVAVDKQLTDAFIRTNTYPVNDTIVNSIFDNFVQIITDYVYICPWQQMYREMTKRHTFSKLYAYIFDQGYPQEFHTAPPRCYPGVPLGQQICHTTDVAAVFGRSNIAGVPYNSTNSIEYTRYVMDSWLSFARTYDPQPAMDYLISRGAAYTSTLQHAAQAAFVEYSKNGGTVHHFQLPPFNSGPSYPEVCAVYEDNGGYSVDRIDYAY